MKKTLAGLLGNVFLVVILSSFALPMFLVAEKDIDGASQLLGPTLAITLTILFILVGISYLYQLWYFAVYYYDLTDNYIIIKKGPITPREINLPYERIQDVYVDQDILDRIFGIYDVHLSSATIMSGAEAHIDGLEKEAADGLRQKLLATLTSKLGKNITQPQQNAK